MRLWLAVFLPLWFACDVTLPHPTTHGAGGASVTVAYEPDAPPSGLPAVVWIELRAEGTTLTTADAVLVKGPVSDTQLRALARDQPTAALVSALVPVTTFVRDQKLILAPTAPLANGSYTVAMGRLNTTSEITVNAAPRDHIMKRIWPPSDQAGSPNTLVYCGFDFLPSISIATTLEPAGLNGTFVTGDDSILGRRCVRFRSETSLSASSAVLIPPAVISSGEKSWTLDPTPLRVATDSPEVDNVACEGDEVAFGAGCALVDDDRLVIRPPKTPLLWMLVGDELNRYIASRDGVAFVVKGIRPASTFALEITTTDLLGASTQTTFAATTKPAHAHVVLNEEYANPIGPEPGQEWVELYNDGLVDAELEGMTIHDIGGTTVLPETTLPSGGFALVVPEAFIANDDVDPQPPPDALIVRVLKLGKNGLSNEGEPLTLTDDDGLVVSSFPAKPKPKSGVSVVRITPSAPDSAPTSFALSADGASPAAPNAPLD